MLYYFSETKFNFCVLKVGDLVNKREIAKQVVLQMDGIAKTASFLKAGLSKTDVCTLCNQGYLERIRHGYYSLAESEMMPEEQLLITLIPEGIVSLDSALFYHGYSDFAPRQWTIAVPRTISRSKLRTDALFFKAYYVPDELHRLGKTEKIINDVAVPIYDQERTICDCFKYRTKIDSELFNKAIHAYAADTHKNLKNLSEYAKQLGVYKKVTELMEVMLNG